MAAADRGLSQARRRFRVADDTQAASGAAPVGEATGAARSSSAVTFAADSGLDARALDGAKGKTGIDYEAYPQLSSLLSLFSSAHPGASLPKALSRQPSSVAPAPAAPAAAMAGAARPRSAPAARLPSAKSKHRTRHGGESLRRQRAVRLATTASAAELGQRPHTSEARPGTGVGAGAGVASATPAADVAALDVHALSARARSGQASFYAWLGHKPRREPAAPPPPAEPALRAPPPLAADPAKRTITVLAPEPLHVSGVGAYPFYPVNNPAPQQAVLHDTVGAALRYDPPVVLRPIVNSLGLRHTDGLDTATVLRLLDKAKRGDEPSVQAKPVRAASAGATRTARAPGDKAQLQLPASAIPARYHVTVQSSVVPDGTHAADVLGFEAGEFTIRLFPASSVPANTSAQVAYLHETVERMLTEVRELHAGHDPSSSLEALQRETAVLNVCFHELARLALVHSYEHGKLLMLVWARYSELLGFVPQVVASMASELAKSERTRQQTETVLQRDAEEFAEIMHEREGKLLTHIGFLESHLESQEIELNQLRDQARERDRLGASQMLNEQVANLDALRMELSIKTIAMERMQAELDKLQHAVSAHEMARDKTNAQVARLTDELREAREVALRLELESNRASDATEAGQNATAAAGAGAATAPPGAGTGAGGRGVDEASLDAKRRTWEAERLRLLSEIVELSAVQQQRSTAALTGGGGGGSSISSGGGAKSAALPASAGSGSVDPREQRWRCERALLVNEVFRLKSSLDVNPLYKALYHPLSHRCARLHMQAGFQVRRAVKSEEWLSRMIGLIYKDKICSLQFHRLAVQRLPFPEFVYEFLLKRFGRKALADQAAYDIVQATDKHRASSLWIELFARALDEDYAEPVVIFLMHVLTAADNSTIGIPYPVIPDSLRPHWICTRRCLDVLHVVFPNMEPGHIEGFMGLVRAKAEPAPSVTVQLLIGRDARGDERMAFDSFLELTVRLFQDQLSSRYRDAQRLFALFDDRNTGSLSLESFLAYLDALHFDVIDPDEAVHLFRLGLDVQFASGDVIRRPTLDAELSWNTVSMLLLRSAFFTRHLGPPRDAPAHDLTDDEATAVLACLNSDWPKMQLVLVELLVALKSSPAPHAKVLHGELVELRERVSHDLATGSDPLRALADYRATARLAEMIVALEQHARGEVPVAGLEDELRTRRETLAHSIREGQARLRAFTRGQAETRRSHVQHVIMCVLKVQRRFRQMLRAIRERAQRGKDTAAAAATPATPDASASGPASPAKRVHDSPGRAAQAALAAGRRQSSTARLARTSTRPRL